MQSTATTVNQYLLELPAERKAAVEELRKVIRKNLPGGFEECMNYGMIGYVVPHTLYPGGYHCDPRLPLPFMNIASQKNFIAVYNMGLYASPALMKWFTGAHAAASVKKLDMGKSCIRYKQAADIPYPLIGELASKISVNEWIGIYESNYRKKSTSK